ncbi:hypothetical protein L596_009646 [Steinernema carpocapsae]|uniref:Uncharacterized protein n=1 Tax=Steinernema carpocapsae TaxID=34508 RepID=A0A4U5PGR3_STECR|nr:hypothetical protein L596_009646 [Steinernema carpocapsae]
MIDLHELNVRFHQIVVVRDIVRYARNRVEDAESLPKVLKEGVLKVVRGKYGRGNWPYNFRGNLLELQWRLYRRYLGCPGQDSTKKLRALRLLA